MSGHIERGLSVIGYTEGEPFAACWRQSRMKYCVKRTSRAFSTAGRRENEKNFQNHLKQKEILNRIKI